MKKLMIIGIGVMGLFSCSNDVESCFEPDTKEVLTGEVVQFSNCSENSIKSEWNFGDGTSSDLNSPSHTFEKPGEYAVILSEFDENGDINTQEQLIKAANLKITKISITGIQLNNENKKYRFTHLEGGCLDDDVNADADSTNSVLSFTYHNPIDMPLIENHFYMSEFNHSNGYYTSLIYEKVWYFNQKKSLTERQCK